MESLRRLTSTVFDTGLVPRGGKGEVRCPNARTLNLTFITERLVVVGALCDAPSDKKRNLVNASDLAQYLDAHHRNNFMIFSLNAFDDVDDNGRQSLADKLHEQLLEFNWERDGMKAHTPPLDLIFRICYALDAWFSLDPLHVALVNCQTGKTRSGVVVACYLLFARLADNPTDAFVEFYKKRWDMKSLTSRALQKKTPQSIQRFLNSFHELLEQQKPSNNKPLLLKAIIFRQLPVELQPCVQIWDDYKLVFCTDEVRMRESREAPVLDWNEEDGFFAILWETGIELDGGFSIMCSFGDDYENADDVDASSKVLFRYADSTLFHVPGLVTLKKCDLDLMKQYEHGFDEDQFSVDLVLSESSIITSRNSIRKDYTGHSVVQQGLLEIIKHHVVLPDPAMHLNFVRMGFSEIVTTFALQCSQNAPNVALDLLHSKGLLAFQAHEVAERVAKKEPQIVSSSRGEVPFPESDQRPALYRQTTAEIKAMQSQRSSFSNPILVTSSLCDTCKKDDFMMRPQIIPCAGRCDKYYHTTCLGLRKIPFGLTTTTDRTNHALYVKKFLSAWECDTCASKSPISTKTCLSGGEIPYGMKLIPIPEVGQKPGTTSAYPQNVTHTGSTTEGCSTITARSHLKSMEKEPESTELKELNQLEKLLATSSFSIEDLMKTATSPGTTPAITLTKTLIPAIKAAIRPPKMDMKSSSQSEYETAKRSSDKSDTSVTSSGDSKCNMILKREVHSDAGENCMRKKGVNPSVVQPISSNVSSTSGVNEAPNVVKLQLKDVDEYARYFRMLRMGCPKEAVKQKIILDGLDPIILELGPSSAYDEVKSRIAITRSGTKCEGDIKSVHLPANQDKNDHTVDVLLKDHDVHAKYFKMLKMGLSDGAVRQKVKVDGIDERALDLGGSAPFCNLLKSDEIMDAVAPLDHVRLNDDIKYARYFKMLQMGVSEEVVRQKMQAECVDESAPDINGDKLVLELIGSTSNVKLREDPIYSKYFKMLKMGLPEGAVKQKMVTENVDIRALELGPDASASQLSSDGNVNAATVPKVRTLRRPRKKLHWQAISDDRLSNLNQQTIWEDEDDDVSFDVDMDELEALFFANQNTNFAKNSASRGQSTALKRKQTVTLIDGKRAMNAAISLARIKLSYGEIADALARFDPSGLTNEQLIGINEFMPTSEEAALVHGYTGDQEMLGEAEKFIIEIAKVQRYASRMECLVYKMYFTSRSAELATSVAHLQKAAEEVKSSRLLKTLLAMVLKLGNTLNGRGEENGIKGFTVDSLLRLGHTKAVNQKTTVLHYLVRLAKKNHPQILDFQAELRSVPLAARESFVIIDGEFKKLNMGQRSLNTEMELLEQQAVKNLNLKVTIKAMQTAASEIETQMNALADAVTRAREEVSNVLDYFREDPKRSPTEFFTTLASFCSMFQRARSEVDIADEAERLKMRRSNSLKPATRIADGESVKARPIFARSQSTADERPSYDN